MFSMFCLRWWYFKILPSMYADTHGFASGIKSWFPGFHPLLHTSLMKSRQEALLLATSCQNWSVPAPMSLVWPSTTTGTENICQSSAMSLKTSSKSLALASLSRHKRFVHVFATSSKWTSCCANPNYSIISLIIQHVTHLLLLEIPLCLMQDPTSTRM